VGVNCYEIEEKPYNSETVSDEGEQIQVQKLAKLKKERNNRSVEKALAKLKDRANSEENLLPHIFEAVKAYATLGEICDVLRDVFGEYRTSFSMF